MSSAIFALEAMVVYLLLLFGIAHYAEKKREAGQSIVSNPYVYALSLGVYCSAWTFYGSIGRAATTGLGFLPIYLGPSLAMLLGWLMIRKMIRISKQFRLTSISDFISFRYGRSYAIGALVTVVSLMVITPYVALQLIAISASIHIVSEGQTLWLDTKLVVALLLGAFAVMFGARHLDPLERHEGLVAVVAFESVVKLIAFLAVGSFITWELFGGYSEIVEKVLANQDYSHLIEIEYVSWFSLTLISFFAILLLPRQFHLMVVENSDEPHLLKAMWIFPLYLLLINLFVPAIAGAGMLLGTPGLKDMFIITIPYQQNQAALAFLVFIGGVSAATAMVLVDSVAVGNMMLNELEMPRLMRVIGRGRDLPGLLLNLKRLNILLVVALGYLFSRAVGYQSLADIGTISFLAASQMAPAALGGLYWKRGSREGAIAGMSAGFLIWIYTALLPTLAKGGWISQSLLDQGPFGLGLLRPTQLLGLELDIWSNSVFWSLLVNGLLYVLVSLMSRPSPEEQAQADGFVDAYQPRKAVIPEEIRSIRIGTLAEVESTLARYIGEEKAARSIETELARLGARPEKLDARQMLELWDHVEKTLTGSLGPSATRIIVQDRTAVRPVAEPARPSQPAYRLEIGKIYLSASMGYQVFSDQVTHGIEGLCITYREPEEVRLEGGFSQTPIIQLSHKRGGEERTISPTNLPLLFVTIKAFVESSKGSIIMLDSLESLIQENAGLVPEGEVLDFVSQLERLARSGRTRILLTARPEALHVQLERDVNAVSSLLFTHIPLPAYLLKVFVATLTARADDPEVVLRETNNLLASGILGSTDSAASCDPDMMGVAPLEIDPAIKLGRRELFSFLRKLGKAIHKSESQFDIRGALKDLMEKYGFSRYELMLTPGTTYVLEDEKPFRSLEIFAELVKIGQDGLCISRYNPEVLEERYDIEPSRVIWLTQKSEEGGIRTVEPTNLPRLSSMISEFLRQATDPVLLMEGLGYLITQSNYETVLRFIQSQRDDIALRDAVLLVHIDPLSLDTKELHRLESEMEPLED